MNILSGHRTSGLLPYKYRRKNTEHKKEKPR